MEGVINGTMLSLALSTIHAFLVGPSAVRLHAPQAPHARHAPVVARTLNFIATLEVKTSPFAASSPSVGEWFASEEALTILMSQAESARRLTVDEKQQRWLVTTPCVSGLPTRLMPSSQFLTPSSFLLRIQFPGMVARSETIMDIAVDASAPRLSITSGESKTVCEGGPPWAQGLLSRINDIAKTTSSNRVELRNAPAASDGTSQKECVSTVDLAVSLEIPGLLLPPFIPAGPFEKAGSESIQKLLDKDMASVLAQFREGYLAFAARSKSPA